MCAVWSIANRRRKGEEKENDDEEINLLSLTSNEIHKAFEILKCAMCKSLVF